MSALLDSFHLNMSDVDAQKAIHEFAELKNLAASKEEKGLLDDVHSSMVRFISESASHRALRAVDHPLPPQSQGGDVLSWLSSWQGLFWANTFFSLLLSIDYVRLRWILRKSGAAAAGAGAGNNRVASQGKRFKVNVFNNFPPPSSSSASTTTSTAASSSASSSVEIEDAASSLLSV